MNRYVLCVVGALLGAACDDGMKNSANPMSPRSTRSGLAPSMQAEPDNTKKNVRDREDTITPMDQGNSTAEVAITASIRKEMMAETSLSFSARNVKVVTMGSRVTLRGPVMSADEKALLAAMAMRTSGVSEVDNQLEVKP